MQQPAVIAELMSSWRNQFGIQTDFLGTSAILGQSITMVGVPSRIDKLWESPARRRKFQILLHDDSIDDL